MKKIRGIWVVVLGLGIFLGGTSSSFAFAKKKTLPREIQKGALPNSPLLLSDFQVEGAQKCWRYDGVLAEPQEGSKAWATLKTETTSSGEVQIDLEYRMYDSQEETMEESLTLRSTPQSWRDPSGRWNVFRPIQRFLPVKDTRFVIEEIVDRPLAEAWISILKIDFARRGLPEPRTSFLLPLGPAPTVDLWNIRPNEPWVVRAYFVCR